MVCPEPFCSPSSRELPESSSSSDDDEEEDEDEEDEEEEEDDEVEDDDDDNAFWVGESLSESPSETLECSEASSPSSLFTRASSPSNKSFCAGL